MSDTYAFLNFHFLLHTEMRRAFLRAMHRDASAALSTTCARHSSAAVYHPRLRHAQSNQKSSPPLRYGVKPCIHGFWAQESGRFRKLFKSSPGIEISEVPGCRHGNKGSQRECLTFPNSHKGAEAPTRPRHPDHLTYGSSHTSGLNAIRQA